MDPEGMVHALKQVHRLLKPDGAMVDIHPIHERPHVEAYHRGRAVFSEPLQVGYLEGIGRAESALAHVVDAGLFAAGNKAVIDFRHHATSPTELLTHWDAIETYSDSPKDPAVSASEQKIFAALASFLQKSGSRLKIALRERASVSLYIPNK
jgi:hypothetical protein